MIADLEELVLNCRHERARSSIREATAAYKAGAFRSAIVSTWLGVVFDFIDKISELADEGDRQAIAELLKLQSFMGKTDPPAIKAAQEFEQDLIRKLKDFGFVNDYEAEELSRLKADRNYCAHPSSIDPQTPFIPTPERARCHLRSAVDILLSQPAVHGKAALEKLSVLILGAHFPTDINRAKKILETSPLERPSSPLLRNFVLLGLKIVLLEPDREGRQRWQMAAAMAAASELHRSLVEDVLSSEINGVIRKIQNEDLDRLIVLLGIMPGAAQWVDEASATRIEEYASGEQGHFSTGMLEYGLRVPLVRAHAEREIATIPVSTLADHFSRSSSPELLDGIVSRYVDAHGFDEANKIAKEMLLESIRELTAEQCVSIRDGYLTNNQVRGSFSSSNLIRELAFSSSIKDDTTGWRTFIQALEDNPLVSDEEALISSLKAKYEDVGDAPQSA